MAKIIKLDPPGPPPYDPRADKRDEQPGPMPPRTGMELTIWNDWVAKGRPDDYDPPRY